MIEKRCILFLLFIFINVLIFLFNDFVSLKKNYIVPIPKDEILMKKNQMHKSKILNKTFLTVKNTENEPDTLAEVVVQNHIDYIPKISVIIPVYNSEKYLQQCLETIINQTLKEIEIICVDDGSIDNSLDLLIKYSQEDKRITVIKQDNLHAGVASNAGLLIAKGKYLSFLDSNDWFELNMLEEMYNKIIAYNADIIICKCKSFDYETGELDEKRLDGNLKLNLIPKKETFSAFDIPNNIFQFCLGWAWDKLFRTDFIRENNIRFQSIINSNDQQFTYTAICLAKAITTVNKRLVIKRHKHKDSISANRYKDPICYLSSFDKIKSNLEKKGIFNLVKESFWKNFHLHNIFLLKNLDQESKVNLYNNLHKKLYLWDYIYIFPPTSNKYRALHYIKHQNIFPTINVAYVINHDFNLCLMSIISLLINSEYENINIILLYNDMTQIDINKINELKEIKIFTFQTINISNNEFSNSPLTKQINKEILFLYILSSKFPNIDKILYLDSDTIIRKSLLSLWEVNLNNKLIAAVEDISKSKDEAQKKNLEDNLYVDTGVLLINTKKFQEINFFDKIENYAEKNRNIFYTMQDVINILTDKQKIKLNPEFNYMEISERNNTCQYNPDYLGLYKDKDPTIVHFRGIKPNIKNITNSFRNEFLKYKNISKNLNRNHLTIPIVLSSDEQYAPFMYTTMISILENAYKKTFYVFYLLVQPNFSNESQNLILKLNDKYKCSIHFIFIKNKFENIIQKIPHITLPTYYRLLIGDILPIKFDKCIYLDIDICVCKDLSELFNIDIKDYYLAGVVAAGYYFSEEKNCKRLNLSSMKQYVNAGVLLMNLRKIREDNMVQKFKKLANRNYDSQDQDVLNVACYGKILTLPPKYNAMVMRLEENNPLLRHLYSEKDIIEANDSPHIIHFANKKKPWNSIGIYMEKFWWNIAKKTPYINSIFNREKIYKDELIKWWFKMNKKKLNIENPKTFNEKIQWLKLYDSTPIKTYLTDKYLVRKWVRDKIGEEYLIPLLGKFNKFDEIDFEILPNRFVIKCNHGSDYNIIVKDKSQLNLTDVKSKLYKWMNENYAYRNGLELQYRDIEHKIIVEKYIDDGIDELIDYKFHCFDGEPKFISMDSDKYKGYNINFYDLKWEQITYKINTHSSKNHSYKKPKLLEKMIELSKILSEGFAYSRIDLYNIDEKIYFGAITFTPSNETKEIKSDRYDRRLGSFIKLPNIYYNIDTGEYYKLSKLYSLYPYYILSIIIISKLIINYKLLYIYIYIQND